MLDCYFDRTVVPQSTGQKGEKGGTKRLFDGSRRFQKCSFFFLVFPFCVHVEVGKENLSLSLDQPRFYVRRTPRRWAFRFSFDSAGLWNNSLGLISDAGHMLFVGAALVIGLIASYMAQWPSSPTYSFGFKRVEVLSGLVNGVFLVFVGVSVAMESLERLHNPPEVGDDQLMATSVGGLLVNIIGLVFFHDVSHAGHDHDHGHDHNHGHSHGHEHVEKLKTA